MDRLLPVICLDAAAGHEVWQTVAFTLLDSLCSVAGEGTAGAKLAGALSKQGYLQAFVSSLKEQEADLSEVLRPDPGKSALAHRRMQADFASESLNALYVYEAKMSFLIRIAATKEGAEKLLEAQALHKLAACSFIEDRPKLGGMAMGMLLN
jgi:nuclear pore complex protein Nup205